MKTHTRNQRLSLLLLVVAVMSFSINPISAQKSTHFPSDNILVNCGSSGNSTDDGRTWVGDSNSNYAVGTDKTITAIPASQDPSVPTVPYMTARIFQTQFTYSFTVSPGRKFIRLYFYPSNYTNPNFVDSDSFFSVSAGPFTLLSNFSALLNGQSSGQSSLVREFSIDVLSNALKLTFAPAPAPKNAFAFVNGIEIVSMPDIFNSGSNAFNQPTLVGTTTPFLVNQNTALQTVARVNVGGNTVNPPDDSGLLYRKWEDDDPKYIYGAATGVAYPKDLNVTIRYPTSVPSYIAPAEVYGSARSMGPNPSLNLKYNLTWIISVDAGFYYLVRLHFCEIDSNVAKSNMRVFDIFINNQTAFTAFDVIAQTNGGGLGVPVYRDFIAFFRNTTESQFLWIALHPNTDGKPTGDDAEMNGLEVFKLNDSTGSLAGPNPPMFMRKPANPTPGAPNNGSNKSHKSSAAIAGGVIGGALALMLVLLVV
ncbi:Receptor-like protein kinase FERONIA [Acorus calamus]|uniref:Receptor-like protein kinase FERONIA n=1 Tax=Acorus calamus TaxID=4465 RepID=A0AAV9CCT0_ACOCL|nr:Receptor-like protein kinase FERONIA [Acorus calamus]